MTPFIDGEAGKGPGVLHGTALSMGKSVFRDDPGVSGLILHDCTLPCRVGTVKTMLSSGTH